MSEKKSAEEYKAYVKSMVVLVADSYFFHRSVLQMRI